MVKFTDSGGRKGRKIKLFARVSLDLALKLQARSYKKKKKKNIIK
jgi:hypothetical protein